MNPASLSGMLSLQFWQTWDIFIEIPLARSKMEKDGTPERVLLPWLTKSALNKKKTPKKIGIVQNIINDQMHSFH